MISISDTEGDEIELAGAIDESKGDIGDDSFVAVAESSAGTGLLSIPLLPIPLPVAGPPFNGPKLM
ncbi:hypothetical protein AXFE_17200 [Acidithrix ferrooxidans]|uniref:Uncharacterized protein n=1 Tax=Acidithrix ferrooxidans TaxID=1280514 RepID=A0A0D8HI56_9ACTN|nr:hypothetical protein AXFE_17200 [Acidithrix ferrooxidans]